MLLVALVVFFVDTRGSAVGFGIPQKGLETKVLWVGDMSVGISIIHNGELLSVLKEFGEVFYGFNQLLVVK